MARNQALDGLRGLSAVCVVLYHTNVPGFVGGVYGVDVFFILSGFLITGILANEWQSAGALNLPKFYAARILRLMPPLIAFLLAYMAVAPLAWPGWHHGYDAMIAAVYLTDYSWTFYRMPLLLRHTWSLAVEFHFYLIWPFVLLTLLRARYGVQMGVIAMLYISIVAWRYANETGLGPYAFPYHAIDTRATGLLIGAAIALSLHRIAMKQTTLDAVGMIGAAGLAYMVFAPLPATFGLSLLPVELCAAGLTVALIRRPRAPVISSRPLVFLGTISYSLYLWHFPINRFMVEYGYSWPVDTVVTLPLSIAMAAVSWFLIEKPAAELRRRLRQPAAGAVISG